MFRDMDELTATVQKAYAGIDDARKKEILQAAVKHLHAFARDVGLRRQEWAAGIDFLTAVGKACTDERQEYILLSDLMGLSILVDVLDYAADGGETMASVLGPFYAKGSPFIEYNGSIILDQFPEGEELLVRGMVKDRHGAPVRDAVLDFWQSAPNSLYAVQDPGQSKFNLRGQQKTGVDGLYAFNTYTPTPYPVPRDGPAGVLLNISGRHGMRAAHLHFSVSAPGFSHLITEVFFKGDPYLETDTVFGVLPGLVIEPKKTSDGDLVGEFDFILKKAD